MTYRNVSAFSLVELSIVLVILGLLVGGILAGQSLIRASELRSVSSDITNLHTATYTFRDKYMGWPGDITNATRFWNETAAGGACHTTPSTGTSTCNGNGDGNILSVTADGVDYREYFLFAKHLSNAGLLQGTYTSISGADSLNHQIPGTNTPRLRFPNAGVTLGNTTGYWAGDATYFGGLYGFNLGVGAAMTTGSTVGPLFRTEELWNIDTKIDDGKPGTGKIMTAKSCADGTTEATANYLLTNNTITCAFWWTRFIGR